MWLEICLLFLMFTTTMLCVDYIANKGTKAEVNGVEVKKCNTNVSCICIALICIAYNTVCFLLFLRVI